MREKNVLSDMHSLNVYILAWKVFRSNLCVGVYRKSWTVRDLFLDSNVRFHYFANAQHDCVPWKFTRPHCFHKDSLHSLVSIIYMSLIRNWLINWLFNWLKGVVHQRQWYFPTTSVKTTLKRCTGAKLLHLNFWKLNSHK